SCQDDFDNIVTEEPKAASTPNTSIAELKEMFWNDATNYAVKIQDEADPSRRIVIAGRVISSDECGNVFKSLVIQDETAALAMSVNSYNLYLNYRVGQEIVMDVTDMFIGKYAGLQQMGMPSWYSNGDTWQVSFMAPEYFYEHAELNGWPEAASIDTLDVATFGSIGTSPEELRKWQSQLVRFQNVHFEEGGTNTFSKYHSTANEDQNRTLVDATGATMTVRTSGYANFCEETLPAGNIDLVGILSYYNTSWQIILIDRNGCIAVGDRPGTEDNPYSVLEAIDDEANGITSKGWLQGYIVGTVAPEVENVTSSSDIQWEAPFILNNTLVVADSPAERDFN
ncbi:MAG: hypothetical protein K2F63_03115, partial [Muribaculaceae bacterium]|nr:hypothetical protein [Muribaculaceae bacterium]